MQEELYSETCLNLVTHRLFAIEDYGGNNIAKSTHRNAWVVLLAISSRPGIAATVTDVLLRRGDDRVFHKLAANPEASFSDDGFATLVKHAEHDELLAEKVGLQFDIPLRLFRELLLRATQAVRSRLLAASDPNSRGHIQSILTAISEDASRGAQIARSRLHAGTQSRARDAGQGQAQQCHLLRICEIRLLCRNSGGAVGAERRAFEINGEALAERARRSFSRALQGLRSGMASGSPHPHLPNRGAQNERQGARSSSKRLSQVVEECCPAHSSILAGPADGVRWRHACRLIGKHRLITLAIVR